MKKNRIFAFVTAAALLCSSCMPSIGAVAAETTQSSVTGRTFYVSTLHGKDSNDGLSEDAPFYSLQKINDLTLEPGDTILLESGSVFTDGYLHLYNQKGSEEAPIVIDKYGDGADPIIDTNGQGIWYQNYGKSLDSSSHKYQGYVSSSILLYDSEYIEINNLEIVNQAPAIETDYNATDVMNRTGVAAVAQDSGTIDHIYLNSLNIHDVIGNVYDKHMNNGGIYFTVFQPHDESTTGISRYNDVKIENCTVENVNRWGIAVGYTAYWNQFTTSAISDETAATYGSTNVVVRNNYVKDAGGDAITMMYCDRPLVEYNVSDGAARQINTTDYSATSSGRVAAAVWPWKCKNAVFQYNEVFDTLNTTNGNGDGQAWDADYGDGTLYQYNYSHNNSGGCVMFCGSQAYQTTFRYNISQNDLSGAMDIAQNPDAHVYNNVFYMKEGVPFIRDRGSGYYGNMVVENNIIYYAGDTARTETWNISGTQTYSNNLYYNYANVPESDTSAVVVSAGTQVFALAGSAPTESSGIAYSHTDATVRSVFDGYKLCAGSPAIGKGKTITDYSCVESSTVDFFGNELKAGETPDIGANQYQENQETVPAAPQKVEASTATSDSVVLSWNAVQDLVGIAGYRIMNDDTVLANVTDGSTSVELTGLTPGTTYTLNVVAYDVNGAESAGQTIVFSTAAKEGSSEEKPSETEKSETPSTGSQTEKNPQTATLTLNQTNVTLYTKGTKTVTLKTSGVSGNVTWTSSNTKVATVKNGVVTAKKAGTTVITATVGSNKAVCNVTVKKASLKVSKKKLTLKKGKKVSLKVKAVPAGKVTYKSSNKKVAKVTSKGVVKAVKAGTCKITITCNGMKKTVKVKVK